MIDSPRLLVSTVPAWNSTTGSDTMSSLLDGYDKSKLACLYVKAEISDSNVCERFFHIIESRVLKSVIKRSVTTGEEYLASLIDTSASTSEITKENKRINRFGKYRNPLLLLVRELLWKFGKWKSKELDEFLDDFNPEVLFFPIESYIYFNRINEYIIHHCKPQKVIGYLWDDNFTYRQNPYAGIFGRLNRWLLRKSVKKMVNSCNVVFAICPKMKRECDAEFGIDSVLLTKPIKLMGTFRSYVPSVPIQIVYTGKLIIGRDQTLAKIVDALRIVNGTDLKAQLHVYTQTELTDAMRLKIDVPPYCILHGGVPQSEVKTIQEAADILLFVESLSGKTPTARLSFSTKLTDYFASGKCIWAVGNKNLAPIDYLRECDAGIISTNEESIVDRLMIMVYSPALIQEYAHKAYECGRKRHNMTDIRMKLEMALTI